MAEKILKTKIALKYNTYEYWTTGAGAEYVPLKGEVCFCAIENKGIPGVTNNAALTAPTVLFKVGTYDGQNDDTKKTFSELKWTSALAADVYEWAKKNEVKVEGDGNAVTGATIKDGYLTFEKGETFATKQELDDLRGGLEADTNTTYNFRMGEGDDAGKLLVERKEVGDADWTRVDAFDFVTPAELNAILGNYYTKAEVDALIEEVEGKIPTEVGVMSVGAGNAIEVTGTAGAPVVNVKLAETQGNVALTVDNGLKAEIAEDTIKAVKVNNAGHADEADVADKVANALTIKVGNETKTYDGSAVVEADVDAAIANRLNGITYTDTKIDELIQAAKDYADNNDANDNTAHTHTAGAGLAMTGEGGIAGTVEYSANIDVKYEGAKIQLIDKTTKAVIGEGFDASAFVKDSYLENVVYNDETNILTFTFIDNEDNLEEIPVDLKDLVDVYTADETTLTKTGAQFSIKDGGVTTDKIADKNVTEVKLEQNVQDALALARTALQAHQDITGKADKVEGATEGNFAALDADGNLVDSGKKAADFAPANIDTGVHAVELAGGTNNGTLKLTVDGEAVDNIAVTGLGTAAYKAEGYFATAEALADVVDGTTPVAEATHATNADNAAKLNGKDENYFATAQRVLNIEDGTTVVGEAAHAVNADKAADANQFGGQLPAYYATKAALDALAGEGNDTTVKAVADRVNALENAGHLTEITSTQGGLKVYEKNRIEIDPDCVFVLDCNY